MKKFVLVLAVLLVSLSFIFAGGANEETGVTKIGISKFLAHPALDACEQGLMDYLNSTDIKVSFDLQNAQGEISSSSSISQKFKSDKVDIAVGIATPTAQSLSNTFTDIPVLFAAVTDPAEAGLVPDNNATGYGTNVCGVSDLTPVEAQIKLFADITGAKTIGIVYASGEANGVVLMEMTKTACENLGIEFVSAAVANSAEVKMATQSIIDRVDGIYIATDNTVISALSSVSDVCASSGKPLFAADPSNCDGLEYLIAWGFDYYSIGVATGQAIEKILNGASADSIGTVYIEDPTKFELWFNLDVAKKLGYTIPANLIADAAVIHENGVKTAK